MKIVHEVQSRPKYSIHVIISVKRLYEQNEGSNTIGYRDTATNCC